MNRYMCPGSLDEVWFIPDAEKKEEILCLTCGAEMEMID